LRRRISIVWKYFIAYSVVVTLAIFVLALLINGTIEKRYRAWVADELRNYALFANRVFRGAFDGDRSRADKLAKTLGGETDIRITLIMPDGTVIADSKEDPARMENHADRPEIRKALSGQIGMSTRYSTTLKERMSYVAVPVMEEGEVKGVVRVSLKSRDIDLLIGEVTRRIVLLSVVMWLIALALTFLFSSLFSSSVRRMVAFARGIADGNFRARAEVRRRDEFGMLAQAMNEMSERLQSLFERLRSQHDELNAIINSMSEGVLVLDRNLTVRLTNSSFREMFSVKDDISGRNYLEAIRCEELKGMVDELVRKGRMRGRMEFRGKVFTVNAISFKGSGGEEFVLVFHDITADAQIEKLKAEFVANASHELRTPLTAIKGYLETIEDEDPETQRRFIQVIRRNVERMSNLVSDLLLLSRLESPEPQLRMEMVDLFELVGDVVKLVERAAKEKGIKLKVDVKPGTALLGDPFLLEQMLLNLLDNAVKYTERGEVSLTAEAGDDQVKIRVSDTGIGIPSEHLPRIFERFYRVDKARSRELGGTGLGLSIVKHIVQLHGGRIEVTSQPGRGSTFTVLLPSSRGNPSRDRPCV